MMLLVRLGTLTCLLIGYILAQGVFGASSQSVCFQMIQVGARSHTSYNPYFILIILVLLLCHSI